MSETQKDITRHFVKSVAGVSETLTCINQGAVIDGDIVEDRLIIDKDVVVNGNVVVTGEATIKRGATIHGDVIADRLTIIDGVSVYGDVMVREVRVFRKKRPRHEHMYPRRSFRDALRTNSITIVGQLMFEEANVYHLVKFFPKKVPEREEAE